MNGAMDNFTGLSRVKVYCRLWTVGHQFGNVRSTSFEYELKYGTFLRAFPGQNGMSKSTLEKATWQTDGERDRETIEQTRIFGGR